MIRRSILAGLCALASLSTARAQEAPLREQLLARGAPVEFADRVAQIVAAAASQGLPTEPLATKALEGWAKRGRVPSDRVFVVLDELSQNLEAGRAAAADAGLDPVHPQVVAAAAEALGRGMMADDVRSLLLAAPTADAAATGLTVASSMAAQGLDRAAAVKVVQDAYRQGEAAPDVLEYPSAVAELRAQGVPMSDVARRILEGGGLPLPSGRGLGLTKSRPSQVPPGKGPPIEPPGQTKPKGKPPES